MKSSTSKPYTLMALVGMALAGGTGYWYMNKPGASSAAQATAPAAPSPSSARAQGVELARVEPMRLQDDAQAVGTLKSNQGVMLRPEVAGKVAAILFKEGARVAKGQTLFQLDDVLQQAEVKQAKAQVSVAAANHKRNQELVARNFIAQRVLDESAAALQVAEAQLALAQARLDRMKVVAPFDGTIGLRNVNVGDYVRDGADLVTIEDLSTMQVDFRLPERYQSSLKIGQGIDLVVDALPGRSFKGRITALDPLLDANGRSVAVRASLPNNAGQALPGAPALPEQTERPLRPGMFARVNVVFGVKDQALVVPEEAIVPLGGRQFVIKAVPTSALPATVTATLGADVKQVSQRAEVRLGIRRPGRVEIVQGLQAGDWVVVAGQQRLQKDGTPVRPVELGAPAVQPAAASASASAAASPAAGAVGAASAASGGSAAPAAQK